MYKVLNGIQWICSIVLIASLIVGNAKDFSENAMFVLALGCIFCLPQAIICTWALWR